MRNRYIVIFPALLLLGACAITGESQQEQMDFLREKSSEIGSKGVILFDIRRRAAEKLIEGCHRKKSGIEAKITCVKTALEIVDPPKLNLLPAPD